jgi:hypothetical protein
MKKKILALSIHQPWSHCIACGIKRVENREWEPPKSMIGQFLAIHATKKCDLRAIEALREALNVRIDPTRIALGAVIAVATLDSVRTEPIGSDPWFTGPFGWYLRDVAPIKPVWCKGSKGLWTMPDDVLQAVRDGYGEARKKGNVYG